MLHMQSVPLFIGPSTHVNIFKLTLFKRRAEAIFDNNIIQCNISPVILTTNSFKNNLDKEINHS